MDVYRSKIRDQRGYTLQEVLTVVSVPEYKTGRNTFPGNAQE
jgi:hypothetical protein